MLLHTSYPAFDTGAKVNNDKRGGVLIIIAGIIQLRSSAQRMLLALLVTGIRLKQVKKNQTTTKLETMSISREIKAYAKTAGAMRLFSESIGASSKSHLTDGLKVLHTS